MSQIGTKRLQPLVPELRYCTKGILCRKRSTNPCDHLFLVRFARRLDSGITALAHLLQVGEVVTTIRLVRLPRVAVLGLATPILLANIDHRGGQSRSVCRNNIGIIRVDPSKRSAARWLLMVVLIGLHFVLNPMAFASPPDPGWLGGLWDDADFDDVILHLTGRCPAVSSVHPHPDATAFATVVGLVPARCEGPVPGPSSFSHDTRAPPA